VVAISELITSPLLQLNTLAMDFLTVAVINRYEMDNSLYNESMTYTSFEAVGALGGAKSSSLLEKLSCLLEWRLRLQPEHATKDTLMGL